jgi:predicted outer membrane repeat protein
MRSDMPVRRRVRERILASGERSPARSPCGRAPRGRAARGCLLLVSLLALAWSAADICLAATLYVAADGTGEYPTIAAAIAAAQEGDQIHLLPGVYAGEGNRNLSFQGKSIEVCSSTGDPQACTIDCSAGGAMARAFAFFSGESPEARLTGITIAGGRAQEGGGILFSLGASPTVSQCIFRECTADRFGGAIYCQGGCAPLIEACIFLENEAMVLGGAFFADVAAAPAFHQCTFAGNQASSGGALFTRDAAVEIEGSTLQGNLAGAAGSGIYCDGNSTLTVERTLISGGLGGEAIYCDDASSADLANSDLYGNQGGDWTGALAGQLGVNGNFSADPEFCEVDPLGRMNWSLQSDSPCAPDQAGVLVGAWTVGCDDTPAHRTSWGHIKSLFTGSSPTRPAHRGPRCGDPAHGVLR